MSATTPRPIDIASVAETLSTEQRRRGRRSIVFGLPKPGAGLPFPWKLVAVPIRVPAMAAVAARIALQQFDLVHVHYATQGLVGSLSGRRYVVHCHGSDIRGLDPSSTWGRYVGGILRRAATVLYSTPDLEHDVARFRSDVHFLPNPIDTDHFAPLGPPDRDVLLGIRLDPIKGAETAIEAVMQLLRRRPSSSIPVIMSGPLLATVQASFGNRVKYVRPAVHADMPSLLARHRVALGQFRLGILSQFELEAMSMGLGVVADIRYRDALGDPPPVAYAESPAAAADQLEDLLESPSVRDRLGETARTWVVEHHGVSVVVDQLDAVYAQALRT